MIAQPPPHRLNHGRTCWIELMPVSPNSLNYPCPCLGELLQPPATALASCYSRQSSVTCRTQLHQNSNASPQHLWTKTPSPPAGTSPQPCDCRKGQHPTRRMRPPTLPLKSPRAGSHSLAPHRQPRHCSRPSPPLDPQQAPRTGRRPPGVESRLLVGKPTRGGFGVMPWREHVAARHATWAIRFVTTVVSVKTRGKSGPPPSTPHWIDLGSHLLSNIFPNTHPALAMLRASHAKLPPSTSDPTGTSAKLGPLARLANGLNSMGRTAEVAKGGRLPPGPWCESAPSGQTPSWASWRRTAPLQR
jgi:hypothetical protein